MVELVSITEKDVNHPANEKTATDLGENAFVVCGDAETNTALVGLTAEILPADVDEAKAFMLWAAEVNGQEFAAGNFASENIQGEFPTGTIFDIFAGCDIDKDGELSEEERTHHIKVYVARLDNLTVIDVLDPDHSVTSEAINDEKIIYLCTPPANEDGTIPDVEIDLSGSFAPVEEDAVRPKILWRVTPAGGATPPTGNAVGDALPRIKLDSEVSREYVVGAGCDVNGNGTLEDSEMSRKVEVVIIKIEMTPTSGPLGTAIKFTVLPSGLEIFSDATGMSFTGKFEFDNTSISDTSETTVSIPSEKVYFDAEAPDEVKIVLGEVVPDTAFFLQNVPLSSHGA